MGSSRMQLPCRHDYKEVCRSVPSQALAAAENAQIAHRSAIAGRADFTQRIAHLVLYIDAASLP